MNTNTKETKTLISFQVLLPALTLCYPSPVDQQEPQEPQKQQEPSIKLGHFKIKLFPFPHLVSNGGDNTRRRVGGFFADNPLISVKRSFQVNEYTVYISTVGHIVN